MMEHGTRWRGTAWENIECVQIWQYGCLCQACSSLVTWPACGGASFEAEALWYGAGSGWRLEETQRVQLRTIDTSVIFW